MQLQLSKLHEKILIRILVLLMQFKLSGWLMADLFIKNNLNQMRKSPHKEHIKSKLLLTAVKH